MAQMTNVRQGGEGSGRAAVKLLNRFARQDDDGEDSDGEDSEDGPEADKQAHGTGDDETEKVLFASLNLTAGVEGQAGHNFSPQHKQQAERCEQVAEQFHRGLTLLVVLQGFGSGEHPDAEADMDQWKEGKQGGNSADDIVRNTE